ncbi:hypothetical protein HYD27_24185 [Paenibacillus sp. S150]|nr:hypothetical protein [Paenibacillus sp. S150]
MGTRKYGVSKAGGDIPEPAVYQVLFAGENADFLIRPARGGADCTRNLPAAGGIAPKAFVFLKDKNLS